MAIHCTSMAINGNSSPLMSSGYLSIAPTPSFFSSDKLHFIRVPNTKNIFCLSLILDAASLHFHPQSAITLFSFCKPRVSVSAKMATGVVQEVLPPALDSTSEPPPIFDGTTRFYISYTCLYAQRTWITRNYKGLQDKIKLVGIDLQNRYKEKVYPPSKVPSLEHNNEVKGESLDLVKYIDTHFEGHALLPDDPAKKEFAEELLSYIDTFTSVMRSSFKGDAIEAGPAFDHLETALSKFNDGPFFFDQFSLVDIAYAPFIERFQPFLSDVKNYDITAGRPKLRAWIEVNKIDAYKQTKRDPKEHVEALKKRLAVQA